MSQTRSCPCCGAWVSENDVSCARCGASLTGEAPDKPADRMLTDDGAVETKNNEDWISRPGTIDELKRYCAQRGMPLERMRFFIDQDYREPRAFGIYRDGDRFVVYKNKASGERSVRYHGPDEAYAVGELYQKLLDECHQRDIYPENMTRNSPLRRHMSSSELKERASRASSPIVTPLPEDRDRGPYNVDAEIARASHGSRYAENDAFRYFKYVIITLIIGLIVAFIGGTIDRHTKDGTSRRGGSAGSGYTREWSDRDSSWGSSSRDHDSDSDSGSDWDSWDSDDTDWDSDW